MSRSVVALVYAIAVSVPSWAQESREDGTPAEPVVKAWDFWSFRGFVLDWEGPVTHVLPPAVQARINKTEWLHQKPTGRAHLERELAQAILDASETLLGETLFPNAARGMVSLHEGDSEGALVFCASYRIDGRRFAFKATSRGGNTDQMVALLEAPQNEIEDLLPVAARGWLVDKRPYELRPHDSADSLVGTVFVLERPGGPGGVYQTVPSARQSPEELPPTPQKFVLGPSGILEPATGLSRGRRIDPVPEPLTGPPTVAARAELAARTEPMVTGTHGARSDAPLRWPYLAVTFVAGAGMGAAGAWLLLRRRSGG